MDAYRAAKLRLFERLAARTARPAVASADMDADTLAALRAIAAPAAAATCCTVGEDGDRDRACCAATPLPDGQILELDGRRHERANIASAAARPLPGRQRPGRRRPGRGHRRRRTRWTCWPRLTGVRGRMELAARLPNGAAVYVDYAHTPDALERLLTALRPHTEAGCMWCSAPAATATAASAR